MSEPMSRIEAEARAKWNSDPNIEREYLTFNAYLAFMKASAAGAVQIYGGTGKAPPQLRRGDSAETRAKAAWDSSASIRAEFGRFETLLAYEKSRARGEFEVFGKSAADLGAGIDQPTLTSDAELHRFLARAEQALSDPPSRTPEIAPSSSGTPALQLSASAAFKKQIADLIQRPLTAKDEENARFVWDTVPFVQEMFPTFSDFFPTVGVNAFFFHHIAFSPVAIAAAFAG